MGRLSQAIDFINRNPLPPAYERRFLYTKISDEDTFKRLRKELHLRSDIETDENPDLFS